MWQATSCLRLTGRLDVLIVYRSNPMPIESWNSVPLMFPGVFNASEEDIGGIRPYLSSVSHIGHISNPSVKSVKFEVWRGVNDHVVTYAATVLYPKLLLFILGNINTMVVVVYQVEPNISLVLSSIRPANPRPRTRMNETRRLTMA